MAGKPRNEEAESFLDRIPMTFRDFPGAVEPTEQVQVTTVLIAPEVSEAIQAVKPAAKKEN